MRIDNNVNYTSFQAKLNVSKMDSYQYYWNKVAKEFAKDTKDLKGEMTLNAYKSYKSQVNIALSTTNSHDGYAAIKKENFKEMTNESATKVGKILAKFFKIAHPAIEDDISAQRQLYKKVGEKPITTFSEGNWEIFKDKFYTPVRNEINKNLKAQIQKDADLSGFEMEI